MPNASKYIIDVANIRPGGNPIKGLYVGSSEKKYATLGNKCIYDKVLYELSVDNISNIEPNAQTVTFTYTSKRTHGDGSVDTLGINPTTSAITANHSTASTKTTTCTVNQSVTNNGTLTGNSVNVTVTQIKNYPTGLTLAISPKSTIPASGGSISSALTNYTYSVTAAYKSGSSSAVTSDSNTTITANATGVTASSKGTTASNATTAGTITFTAKYVCNGETVTASTSVNIIQNLNKIESYNNPTFTLTPSSDQTLPASGGSVTASVSDVKQVRNWSSTSTDEISLTANASSNGYSVAWTNQTISCNSRETTTGETTTLGTTTANVTSTNGGNRSKSYTVYQQANAITAYSKPTGLSLSCADIPAGGGTVTAATGGTISQTRTYTSKATDTINPTVTITWDPAQTATANSLEATDKARTKITTLTATYSANGQSNSTSVDVYQQANGHTDSWNNPVVTIAYATFSAAGETKTPTTCSATQSGTRTWTSGSQTGITNTSFTWGNYSMTNGTGFTLSDASTGAVTAASRGTTTGAARSNDTIRRTATGAGSKQGTGSGTVTQEANAVTATTWNNPVVTVSPSSRSVGSADTSTSFTASATQSGVDAYTSTSTAATSNSTFTWAWSSNKTAFTANSTTTACTVSFAANPGTSSRSATITAKATGNSKEGSGTATVTQAGKQSLLTPSVNSVSISFESFDPPTPTIGTLSIQLQNPTNKTIYLALSTNGEESGIVASGSMSPNNAGTLFTYKPTSTTQRLYCLIKASGTLNNYFGVGIGPQWGYWIDGVYASGSAKSVVVGSSWQKITSSATYLPTGSYAQWGSSDTNVPFFFANA